MIKLQVEGQETHVQAFICDLQQRPQIDLLYQEVESQRMKGKVDMSVTCYVNHLPNRRLTMIQMDTVKGEKLISKCWI